MASIVYESTIDGEYVLSGEKAMLIRLRLQIITSEARSNG